MANVLMVVDLAVWFLLGVFLVLFYASYRRPAAPPPPGEEVAKPSVWRRVGLWLLALAVGAVLAGGRFLLTNAGRAHAVRVFQQRGAIKADATLPDVAAVAAPPAAAAAPAADGVAGAVPTTTTP